MRPRATIALAALTLSAAPLAGQQARRVAIIPEPASVIVRDGTFRLTSGTTIQAGGEAAPIGARLAAYLRPATGYPLDVTTGGAASGNRIVLQLDAALERLGPEGYVLDAAENEILIRAPAPAGLFYGVQTLRQLLPPENLRDSLARGVEWHVPAVLIEDSPRFRWRGMHLDVARHFMPKEFVLRFIDLLALHRLNSFHWHLTEDQGWRIEIRKYPRLTEVGAWRTETLVGHMTNDSAARQYDGTPHGGFYTQDDIREVVEYARQRFITVVPEIEMPGHAQAAIAAYPELGNTGDTLGVWTHWGVSQNILNPEESTIRFMQDVLSEVLELFPGTFIHIGGDEAPKTQWRASPRAQARMRELGLANEEELQSWFIRRMDAFLVERGRRLVGWDEILEGGLAPNATVMSWRGVDGGIAAARAGHDVVMAPTGFTYFDYYQSRDTEWEPLAIGGFLPLDRVYSFEPIPPDLEPEFHHHILGAQAQLWTEYMTTTTHVEYMAFPRVAALAEVVWTPRARRDLADFRVRLATHLRRLDALGVNYRPEP